MLISSLRSTGSVQHLDSLDSLVLLLVRVVAANPWESPCSATYRQVEADDDERLDVHTIACEDLETDAPFDAGADVADAVDKRRGVDEGAEHSFADDVAGRLACPRESRSEKTPRAVVVETVLHMEVNHLAYRRLPMIFAASDEDVALRPEMESSTDSVTQLLHQIALAVLLHRCSE